jgi:hypothetical protein
MIQGGQRILNWLKRAVPRPDTWTAIGRAWRWSAVALIALIAVTLLWPAPSLYGALGIGAILGLLLLAALAAWLVLLVLAMLPNGTRGGLLLLAVPAYLIALLAPLMQVALLLFLLVAIGLVAAGAVRTRRGQKRSGVALLVGGGLSLVIAVAAFLIAGWPAGPPTGWPPIQAERLDLPNPGLPGAFPVLTYSYGSGSDRHRSEFGAEASWVSDPVDGSKLLDGWEGAAGWARTRFWGFDATALPVQGRVWMPDGQGPFPLILIVHGNHEGPDFSDVGYDYLGELLASRGVITVSVDENFLNSFMGNFLGGPQGGLEEESDARGWMLLQHLAQWRRWTEDEDHPMHGKADLDRVLLIGHSRGGEAVSEAAQFNRLSHYPDDGTLDFDFGFGIRGIIAIAPVDDQYDPRDRDTALEDVSLLTIHGSHDADVNAFAGTAMYSRLRFDRCTHCFKSSFYLLGANHGQFNTSWGRYDVPFPVANMLNVVPLIPGEAQRAVAKVMFGAFAELVLFDNEAYRPFLARPERGAHWFPEGMSYLTNYSDSRLIRLADFEDDADLSTGSVEVRQLSATGLSLWKEAEVPLRWGDMDSAALLVGWSGAEEDDPTYEIELLEGGLAVAPTMALSFSAAMATEAPGEVEDYEVPKELDFEIELVDRSGRSGIVHLKDRRPLFPQVDPVLYKLEALGDSAASEPTFQRFVFPFSAWSGANPELDLSALATIRFRFDKTVPASVWLDDIAISPEGY